MVNTTIFLNIPVGDKAMVDLIASRFSIINCVLKIIGTWIHHGDALV